MPQYFRFVGTPNIITGVVTSTKNAGGQIGVRLEHWTINDIDCNTQVSVVGTTPKVNDRGLILFADNNDKSFQNGYWLGSTHNRFKATKTNSEQFENKLPDTAKGLIDSTGNQQIVASNANVKIRSRENEFTISTDGIIATNNIFTLSHNTEGFTASTNRNGSLNSKLAFNSQLSEIYSVSSILIRTQNDINIKSNGNVTFSANSSTSKPLTMFQVKASKVLLSSGSGATTIQGSAFNVKVGSSSANGLGTTAASIEVLQGNMDYSVGVGNINVRAMSPAHKVKIMNGFLLAGVQSYFEANGTAAKMGAELIPGLGATIECTRIGAINIKAAKSVKMESMLGMTLNTMTTMDISSLVSMKIESMKMDIIAQAMIMMKAAMMDLKGVKMIDAGPKVVTPGPGPFCAMPVCPILGCTLSGSIAIG